MTDPLSTDAYYDQRLPSAVAVAPGGDRAAVLATEYDGEEEESLSSLFVVPADGSEEPYRLTRASDASSPKWSPGGSKLAFLATRETDPEIRAEREYESDDEAEDGDGESDAADGTDADEENGDGEEEQQVWIFDMDRGGDARQVTTREEGVTDFDWGPEGDRIAISARDPTEDQREYLEQREDDGPIEVERTQHKVNGRGWLDDVDTYLFVVDVEERAERRVDAVTADGSAVELGGGGLSPEWGPNGAIAYRTNDGDDPDDTYVTDLWTVDPDAEEPTPERVTDGEFSVGSYAWAPDGDRLAFVASHPKNKHVPGDLYVTDGEREEYRCLTDDLDRTLYAVDWVGPDELLATVGDEGLTRLRTVDLDGNREPAFPDEDEFTEPLPYSGLSVDPESGLFGTVVTTPNGRDAHAVAVGGEATRLTDFGPTQAPESDVECERVRFDSDGVEVEALAYWDEAGAPPEDRPLLVDIHGGPMAYDGPRYSFRTHFWTSRDYVVLQVNYRGSTSYGREFSEAIRGDWGPRETADIVSGVEAVVDRGWADPDRVFVTGFSQGGVNTAYVLTRSDVATAGAAEHGIYDYRSAYGTDDSHVWWDDDFGQPWSEPETYDRTSSITDVDRIEDPLLITAGGQDWRCPPTQAEQLYVSVKKQGVPAKLVVYPDLPHSYGGPEDATHRLETLLDWFEEHDPAVED